MSNNAASDIPQEKDILSITKIVLAGLFIFLVWGISGWITWSLLPASTDHGTFGDMFGAINALFSGLAFLGVVAALVYQRQELKYQRQELIHSRKAQQVSAEEFQRQNEISVFVTKLDALNHAIEYCNTHLSATKNMRTVAEQSQKTALESKRTMYESALLGLVDKFIEKGDIYGSKQ